MLKKAVLAFFNHDRSEVNYARSHNFNELTLVEIGDPSMDRTQGVEKQVFQLPDRLSTRFLLENRFAGYLQYPGPGQFLGRQGKKSGHRLERLDSGLARGAEQNQFEAAIFPSAKDRRLRG